MSTNRLRLLPNHHPKVTVPKFNGVSFRLTNNNLRDDEEKAAVWDGVGKAVASCLQLVPGGTLIFFPSYGKQRDALAVWRERGLLAPASDAEVARRGEEQSTRNQSPGKKRKGRGGDGEGGASASAEPSLSAGVFTMMGKPVYIEDQDAAGEDNSALIQEYKTTACLPGPGAVFLGVMRGRASEGE